MKEEVVILILMLGAVISIVLDVIIWGRWIRPYLRYHGKSVGHGANIGWTILADASIATDHARELKKIPWFLYVYWTAHAFLWIIPVAVIVFLLISSK